jgi:predicted NBD/HSP70 family sugar kinase
MNMEKCGISKLDLKRRNRMQILRVIKELGPISRVDVASELRITRAAVTIITNEMIEEGVLVEIGEAPVNTEKLQKGRRKILIGINENYKFALGATIEEREVSIGLSTLNGAILDKDSMIIDDKTMTKDIIAYIIKKSNEMLANSCLTKEKVLGLGIGVVPAMWGRLKIFYKDGVLDFSNFIEKVATGVDLEIQCGNATGLLALASNDFDNYNGYQCNQVFINYGNQINMAVLNKNALSSDYMSYTYMVERFVVNPGGRAIDGYPEGSVKAEIAKGSVLNAFGEVYSKEKTPILFEQTNGEKSNINIETVTNAFLRGEEPVVNIVNKFVENFAVLLNNLVCVNFAHRVILHNFDLSEKQLDFFKRGIAKYVGEDVADKVVLSRIEKKCNFVGGCALIIQNCFYFKGGMK